MIRLLLMLLLGQPLQDLRLYSPSLSHNGTWMVFNATSSRVNGIGIMRRNSGTWRLVPHASSDDIMPQITDDGRAVFLMTASREIHRIDVRSGRRKVVVPARVEGFSISATNEIWFSREIGRRSSAVLRIREDGTGLRREVTLDDFVHWPMVDAAGERVIVHVGGEREVALGILRRGTSRIIILPTKITDLATWGARGAILYSTWAEPPLGRAIFATKGRSKPRLLAGKDGDVFAPALDPRTGDVLCIADYGVNREFLWLDSAGEYISRPVPSARNYGG